MPFASLPTRGPADLQAAITDVRAPVTNELSADSIEAIKDRIIQIGTALGVDDGSTPGSVREATVALLARTGTDVDDFTGQALEWVLELDGDSSIKIAASASAYGFPSRGVILLEAGTAGGNKATITRIATGLVLGASDPIVLEARCFVPVDDEQSEWFVGAISEDEDSGVAWCGLGSGAARIYRLVTINGGIVTTTNVGAPPACTYFDLRLTIAESGTTVEIAPDDGDYQTIGTAAVPPDQVVYKPWARVGKGSGTGNRSIVLDSFGWGGSSRTAEDPGSITGDEFHTPGGAISAADKAKLDGIEALADVTDAANVAAAGAVMSTRTLTTTAPLTIDGGGSADLSANRTFSVNASSTSAAGIVELATSAEAITGTDTDRAVTPKALADTLQPAGRSVSGTTDTIVAGDIGNIVLYSQAGGVTVDLATLAASLISGRSLVLTLQGTDAATVITVDPNTSVTIDGSASTFVAATGKSRVSLISLDGLAWYSGTP